MSTAYLVYASANDYDATEDPIAITDTEADAVELCKAMSAWLKSAPRTRHGYIDDALKHWPFVVPMPTYFQCFTTAYVACKPLPKWHKP